MTAPFPACIVDLLAERIQANIDSANITGVATILKSELKSTDPNGTVAIEVADWNPLDYEIGSPEAAGQYCVFLNTMIKNSTRDEGRAASSILGKSMRAMLARDRELHVQLAQLSETSLGYTERVRRGRLKTQRFLDGDTKGMFTFITMTQFDVDTEIV